MSENYGLYFSANGQTVRLPINPETFPIARSTDNSDYNVLGIGQIVIPRTPNLKTISISSFFPGREFSGVLTAGGFQPPEFYINFFESAMRDKSVVVFTAQRFYENGEPFYTSDTALQCVVTAFDTEERGGETGDFYYTLELTEWRDYAPKEWKVQAVATPEKPAVVTEEPTRSVPTDQIVVGSVCVANGRFYASSYGDEPHGNGNGRTVGVSRIVDKSRAYPYHIVSESGGALGWINADGLELVSATGAKLPPKNSKRAQTQAKKATKTKVERFTGNSGRTHTGSGGSF